MDHSHSERRSTQYLHIELRALMLRPQAHGGIRSWFSEEHASLVEDAAHWFVGTKGAVKLVITIDINEEKSALAHYRTSWFYQRVGRPVPHLWG